MTLDDLEIKRLPKEERLVLPDINKGDAVLVYARSGETFYQPEIFCSDGRVAQTDIVIGNEPYDWVEHVRNVSPNDINVDGTRAVVSEAIRRGFLKEFVEMFGRDADVYGPRTCARESHIVNLGPTIIFGYDPTQVFDLRIKVGDLISRLDLFAQQNPYLAHDSDNSFWYPLKSIKRVIVGKENILSELRSSPLEISLEQGYCEPLQTD